MQAGKISRALALGLTLLMGAACGDDDSDESGGTGRTGDAGMPGSGDGGDPCAGAVCGDWCLGGRCNADLVCSPVFAPAVAALMSGEELGASGAGGGTGDSCPAVEPSEGDPCPTEGQWCYYVPRNCSEDTPPTSISLCLCGHWIDDGAHCDPI